MYIKYFVVNYDVCEEYVNYNNATSRAQDINGTLVWVCEVDKYATLKWVWQDFTQNILWQKEEFAQKLDKTFKSLEDNIAYFDNLLNREASHQ